MATTKKSLVTDQSHRKIVTPITGVLALVIGISGVMLFFHVGEGLVKEAHEWLGVAFAVVMLVHLAMNWKAFKQHFKKPVAWIGTGAVSVISVMFLMVSLSGEPHENPIRSIMQSIETASVIDLAPVFKLSQAEMTERLNRAGVNIDTGRESLQELAGKSGLDSRRLIAVLVSKGNFAAGTRGGMSE
jgi:hypothetical protein